MARFSEQESWAPLESLLLEDREGAELPDPVDGCHLELGAVAVAALVQVAPVTHGARHVPARRREEAATLAGRHGEVDELDLVAVRATLEELAMLQVDSQMAGLSLRRQVRQILTPTQLEEWSDMRGDDDVHLVISGVSTSWSNIGWSNFGRFGC